MYTRKKFFSISTVHLSLLTANLQSKICWGE